MALLSLGQAAKAAGISKATVSKSLASGRLSYVSKGTAGYQIDTAELFRVFPPKQVHIVSAERSETPINAPANGVVLSASELEMMRQQIEDLRADRDAWRDQAQRLALAPPDSSVPVRRRFWGFGPRE
jgi:predicted DNA-binding protein (UPF0251 family)